MNAIRKILFKQVSRPMRTLFATALGKKTVAVSVLVTVVLDDGSKGTGEVPTSFVMPHETVAAIKAILAEARRSFIDVPFDDCGGALADLRRRHSRFHMTLGGLEVATFRAALAARGIGEHAYWGGRLNRLETDITVPFIPSPDMLADWLGKVTANGFRTYKIKVSGKVDADIRFIKAVREILTERVRDFIIRLDGNQGYTARTYLQMLSRLERAGIEIELFEQPLRKDDLAGLRRIRGHGKAPLILDETVFTVDQCRRVIDERLADGVNIKIAKSGIAGSAAILRLAKSAGLKLMIGCMTETMVGLSAGINLAAGSGDFDYVDLDSIHLIHHKARYGNISINGREYILEDSCQC